MHDKLWDEFTSKIIHIQNSTVQSLKYVYMLI